MPVKKSTRSKASAASKKPAATAAVSDSPAPSQRQFSTGAMLVAAMCLTGAVIVIAAHGKTSTARVTATEARPDGDVSAQPKAVVPASAVVVAPDSMAKPESDAAKTSAVNSAPVTIFGCLERSNDTYRLTDTDGVDAPKARSWRSAFLKKGAATVEVVDPGNRTHLSSQVGHRVGVTGTLTERQLQVRSIRRISSSCTD
jgi:hypothetical protein